MTVYLSLIKIPQIPKIPQKQFRITMKDLTLNNTMISKMGEGQQKYSKSKQRKMVSKMAICFMLNFTSYYSIVNMLSQIYDQEGYNNLGQINLFAVYITFGLGVFITTHYIRKIGYKKAMMLSCLGYITLEATGIYVSSCSHSDSVICGKSYIYTTTIIASLLNGFGNTLIWVANPGYIKAVSNQSQNQGQLFGLFWGIMMWAQVLANIFTTFIIKYMSLTLYFSLATLIGFFAIILFWLLLQDAPIPDSQQSNNTLMEEMKQMYVLINRKNNWLWLYSCIQAVSFAFYTGFLYKIVELAVPRDKGEQIQEYKKRLGFHTGLILICVGVSQVIGGFIYSRFSDYYNKTRLGLLATLTVQFGCIFSLLAYFHPSYLMCYFLAICWGFSDIILQSNTDAMIAFSFDGKLQAFSVKITFFSAGAAITYLLNIIFSMLGFKDYVFLFTVVIIQIITTMIGLNISELPGYYNKKEYQDLDEEMEHQKSDRNNKQKSMPPRESTLQKND